MIRSYLYNTTSATLKTGLAQSEFAEALKDPNNILWVDIESLEDENVELLLNTFGLHPLTIEDCIMPNYRPKIEEFENYLFIILHAVEKNGRANGPVEIDICLGKNFLITLCTTKVKAIATEQRRLEERLPVMARGADFLLYSLLDSVIEQYAPLIEELDKKVDMFEAKTLSESSSKMLTEMFDVQGELSSLRRMIYPQRDAVGRLSKGETAFIKPSNTLYFRDAYDHILRVSDSIDMTREALTGVLQEYGELHSARLNEVMKTLTIVATVAMPAVLITSFYGMNLKIPEFNNPNGYPIVLSVIIVSTIAMLFYIKKKKWI